MKEEQQVRWIVLSLHSRWWRSRGKGGMEFACCFAWLSWIET